MEKATGSFVFLDNCIYQWVTKLIVSTYVTVANAINQTSSC